MEQCGLNPGRLRHRIELHSAASARDSYGQPVETFTKYADAWASIVPMTGREQVQNEQVKGDLTHKVLIRYNAAVNRTDRVIFGIRTLEIVYVINIEERGRYMELQCKELV